MPFCQYCGSELEAGANFCISCGAKTEDIYVQIPQGVGPDTSTVFKVREMSATQNDDEATSVYNFTIDNGSHTGHSEPVYAAPVYDMPSGSAVPSVNDSGSIGWGILGLFFPLVGIILYFVWKSTKPKTAKVSLYGALIGFAFNIFAVGMGL